MSKPNMSQIITRIDSAMAFMERMITDLESANEQSAAAIARLEARCRSPRYRLRKGGAL
jgi:prefoldin subunit 5